MVEITCKWLILLSTILNLGKNRWKIFVYKLSMIILLRKIIVHIKMWSRYVNRETLPLNILDFPMSLGNLSINHSIIVHIKMWFTYVIKETLSLIIHSLA